MPGLVGYTDKLHKYNGTMLLSMTQLLKHFNWYISERPYSDKQVYASRTHLGIIDQGKQPVNLNNRFYSWIEGEFYNREELISKYNVTSVNDNDLFINIYFKTMSFDFLRDVDGYYAAVLYDKMKSIVYLITDRYGFKPLYWGIINGNLVWSSELKGFLGHKDFKINIDSGAVIQFFDIGYLLENRTWFEDVELMPPASLLVFNIKESKFEITHYWSWSEIKPIKGSIDERGIAEELGRLFRQSVRKRVNINERVGITLSGGLDSRAILAAVPEDYKPLHTFTFGQEGCDDLWIAKKASEIKGGEHHASILNQDNWLKPRISGVWRTDGLENLLHMHGMEFYDEYKPYMDFVLNGFLGGAVIGGSYLTPNNLDTRITSKLARDIMNCKVEVNKFSKWYLIDKTDPYFINNRGRRFINTGPISMGNVIEQRIPFFDNELIKFVYSIPDLLRYKSHIYNKMLLSCFPKYFNSIPWQKTGCPISYPDNIVRLILWKNRVISKLKREAMRIGLKFTDSRNYTDYPYWLRQKPAKSFFENMLYAKDAIYPEYVNKANIQRYLRDHMQNKANYHNELCLALTFELWLRQVFEGKYRE
jgi:asparagine synthase (glutamine-hydrolysing)